MSQHTMHWDKLRTFYTVAKIGTFTSAGEAMGLSQSAVSRQIISLEESLGVKLFNRHARGLILTEQGEILHQTVQEVFTKLALTEAMLTENKTRPSGLLKVSTTPTFGTTWLTPRLSRFFRLFPDITLNLRVEDGDLNLRTREADVSIRLHETVQFDLIQRHLASFPLNVYASQRYVEEHGMPMSLADLPRHRVLALSVTPSMPFQNINWLMTHYTKYEKSSLEPFFESNSIDGIANLVKSDVGICALPAFALTKDHGLVQVLRSIEPPSMSTFYVYPVELRSSKRVRVFRDFLMEEISAFEEAFKP